MSTTERQHRLRQEAVDLAGQITPLREAARWADADRAGLLNGHVNEEALELNYRLQVVLGHRIASLRRDLNKVLEQIDPTAIR